MAKDFSTINRGGEFMLTHLVELTVSNASAVEFYDFMINPGDERYSEWWPGEHLQFHIVKRGGESHIGDIVFMDEYLGKGRRLRGFAIVVAAERPQQITWQMKKAGLRLPIFVTLGINDSPAGLQVSHELRIGYSGLGKLLDPLIKIYFNKSYRAALKEHCEIEWPRLAEMLNKSR